MRLVANREVGIHYSKAAGNSAVVVGDFHLVYRVVGKQVGFFRFVRSAKLKFIHYVVVGIVFRGEGIDAFFGRRRRADNKQLLFNKYCFGYHIDGGKYLNLTCNRLNAVTRNADIIGT